MYFNQWQDVDCLTSLKRACLTSVETKMRAPSEIPTATPLDVPDEIRGEPL